MLHKNSMSFIRLLLLFTELFKFEIQKCGPILCAHKPYFLMPGHKYVVNLLPQTFSCEQTLAIFYSNHKSFPSQMFCRTW